VIVSGDRLVFPHSVSCNFPLARSEPLSVGIIVGHKIRENKCKHKTERAEEQKEYFPRSDRRVMYC
jgi:hypothetical protein